MSDPTAGPDDVRSTSPSSSLQSPEDKGAPVAESHIEVSEHAGRTRVDIADDAAMRPGPGQGQPEADDEPSSRIAPGRMP